MLGLAASPVLADPFVAVDPARPEPEPIVISADWAAISGPRVPPNGPEAKLRDSVLFLQEAIRRMTGRTPAIADRSTDRSRGIVVTLATPDLLADPAVAAALANDGSDGYNHREAFFLRSEAARLLVVANTADGLVAAVPALLETVDYEVLAMGPNWIHVPKGRERLVFDVALADRPSFYLRQLTPTSGQSYGVGTIDAGPDPLLTDPADEPVSRSWRRWAIALRNGGSSMDPFPGHALYRHHRPMLEEMRRRKITEGFLTPGTRLGRDAERPAPAEANRHHLWINTDEKGAPGFEKAYLSDGETWKEQPINGMSVNLDITSPLARGIVLEDLKRRAEAHFAESPDDPLVYGTEAEDGAGQSGEELVHGR